MSASGTGAGGTGPSSDRITLTGLRAFGYHGVLAEERRTGQEFRADVTLHLGPAVIPAAAREDELEHTVSYADVAEDVVAVLAGEPVDLLETLVERIAAAVLARPPIQAVDVTVHKPQAPIPVEFDDVTVTIHRLRRRAVLALGANLGDARATLRSAVLALGDAPGVDVTGVSPLARTAPVLAPGQDPQPDYLNAVVTATTALHPEDLLRLAQRVEEAHGRVRAERWGARTLDIDLIAVGDLVQDAPGLTLPHPRAHERAFVLEPWARLDPAAVLPGPHGGPVAELAARAADRDTLQWEAEDWA